MHRHQLPLPGYPGHRPRTPLPGGKWTDLWPLRGSRPLHPDVLTVHSEEQKCRISHRSDLQSSQCPRPDEGETIETRMKHLSITNEGFPVAFGSVWYWGDILNLCHNVHTWSTVLFLLHSSDQEQINL